MRVVPSRAMLNCLTLALVMVGMLTAGTVAAKKKKDDPKDRKMQYGLAVVDAEKCMNLEEGTLEMWVALDYDYNQNMLTRSSQISPMTFFAFRSVDDSENTKRIGLGINTKEKGTSGNRIHFSSSLSLVKVKDRNVPGQLDFKLEEIEWKKEEWHYVAVTWKHVGENYEFNMYLDDLHKTVTKAANEFIPKDLTDYRIYIGAIPPTLGKGLVEFIRVSSKVRTKEEMDQSRKKGLEEDDATLFFFDYKTAKKMQKYSTIGDIDRKPKKGKGNWIGPYKTTKGKFKKAVQFFK